MRHINLHILAQMLGFEHVEELCSVLIRDDVQILHHDGFPRYTAENYELLGFLHRNPKYRNRLEKYKPIDVNDRDIQNTLLCRCEL